MATPIARHLVVYDHPADCPDYYVARWWNIYRDRQEPEQEQQAYGFKSLDTLWAWIAQEYPDLVKISRMPDDEPQILEVWI